MIATLMVNSNHDPDVESAVRDLVRMNRVDGSYYVNLPLLYPDGSFVTVRIDRVSRGVRVSDAGFAYREIEDLNAGRSFRRIANDIAEKTGVNVSERQIFVETNTDMIERAICDVAETSWRVVSIISQRIFDKDESELIEELNSRLKTVFGPDRVQEAQKITGMSTTEWSVSAVVSVDDHKAVFQAVSDNANSVFRTSTAFRDISETKKPLRLIAFVRSKEALGSKLSLLAPGRVVEEGQADEFFRRAAA